MAVTRLRVVHGLIMSSNTNSFHIHQNGCSLQEVYGTTYPTPSFLFDLAHLSSSVPGSLLELPPLWLCPLDGEGGGHGGRWQRWKGCSEGC